MAKSAFDDNVPRVRPRLRLGKAFADIDSATEPPPVRSHPLTIDPEGAEHSAPSVEVVEPPDQLQFRAEEQPVQAPIVAAAEASPVDDLTPPSEQRVAHVSIPAVGVAEALPAEHETSAALLGPTSLPPELPPPPPEAVAPVESEQVVAPVEASAEDELRRASIKRRAAGLSAIASVPPAATPTSLLEELDALESTAEMAAELQRALTEAADANEHLRSDLSAALDDLARSTAESKRLHERADKLDAETRERARVVHDLVRELELLEAERDSALMQSSDAQLEVEAQSDKLLTLERRTNELERVLADSQARTKRFEEAAQAHTTQRAALRAELDGLRRERDTLLARNAELEREREELGRSRKTLDEVHRALSEARSRAQSIRPR